MEIKSLLTIFLSITCTFCKFFINQKDLDDKKSITIGIRDVIDVFYIKEEINFDIILLREFAVKSAAIVETILSQSDGNYSYRIEIHEDNYENKITGIEKSAVIFAHSCADLMYINRHYAVDNQFPPPLKFLVYLDNCNIRMLSYNLLPIVKKESLGIYRSEIEVSEYVFVNCIEYIVLITFEWFSKGLCNSPKINLLNYFDKKTLRWKVPLKNYQKFQNFHNCELVMPLLIGVNIWGSINSVDEDNYNVFGIIPDIFKILSKKYNYRFYFQPVSVKNASTLFHTRKHIDGLLVPIKGIVKPPNVFFHLVELVSINSLMIHMTMPFLQVKELIFVTPGDLYTPYEKLSLPFDRVTWIMFTCTFIVAFIAILLINWTPEFIQNIVYGIGIKTPTLNVISIFFGHTLHKLPNKNFPRYILILFVLFCLVLRTCYQSKMFEFLTSEPRKSPPESVDDLVKRGYTFYIDLEKYHLVDYVSHEKDQW